MRRLNPMWHRLLTAGWQVAAISLIAAWMSLEPSRARAWPSAGIVVLLAGLCLCGLALALVRRVRAGLVGGLVYAWALGVFGVSAAGAGIALVQGAHMAALVRVLLGATALLVATRLSPVVRRGWDVTEADAREDRRRLFGRRDWRDVLFFGIFGILILVVVLSYALGAFG